MNHLLVKDWMTTDLIVAHPNDTLPNAHKKMMDHNIRRLPVMEGNRMLGIITRSDILEAQPSSATSLSVWELNYLLSNLTLDQIMTTELVTVSPEATLAEAANLLNDHKIGALPVMDGERLAGILTESDLFRVLVDWFNEQSETALAATATT